MAYKTKPHRDSCGGSFALQSERRILGGKLSLNASGVYRISTALIRGLFSRLCFLWVLGLGKEHRGRYVLCIQSKADLGNWMSIENKDASRLWCPFRITKNPA
jgi:hypothetical protein